MTKCTLFLILFLTSSCQNKNEIKDIVYKDKVNLDEFVKVNSSDELIDVYQYKNDTFLIYQERFYPGKKNRKGHSFYYQNKKIGKWLFLTENGELLGTKSYQDDLQEGFDLLYMSNNKLKYKRFFREGELIYEINYDDNGVQLDSISHIK